MTGKSKGLIPRSEQAEHNEKTRTKVLEFLSDETFAVVEVLQELLDFKSKQGVNGVMKKLADTGLVKQHKMKNFAGRGLVLWGITSRGIYAIKDPEDLPQNVRGFDPTRVSLSTLDHKIKIQLLKITALTKGWNVHPIDHDIWDRKVPDMLSSKSEDDELVAWEVELTIKTQKRYEEIISDYAILQNEVGLKRVVWVTETDRAAAQLKNIFDQVDVYDGDENPLALHRFISFDSLMEQIS